MRVGIDASNLRAGGGVTHLVEILRVADPVLHGFSQVIVWGGQSTLRQIEERPWLVKVPQPLLDGGLIQRAWWQRNRLSDLARSAACDVLLVPGGSYSGSFRPIATMSRNMQPFELRELRRHGISLTALRLVLLRWAQARSFRAADGVIFLTGYARDAVLRVVGKICGETTIIPHGIDAQFAQSPRGQLPIGSYSTDKPFRILYVSIINVYKHQWHVADAVAQLRSRGLPVTLDLVGPAHKPALARLRKVLRHLDPNGEFVRYLGPSPRSELPRLYMHADLCLFASSCENMPNILLEGMASGLPIACSNRGPMPEVLHDGGVYFDPENPQDIARALQQLIDSPELRTQMAHKSFVRVRQFSWTRCATETFRFLGDVARSAIPEVVRTEG